MGSVARRLPTFLRPAAGRAGLEAGRLKLALRERALGIRLRAGRGVLHLHGNARPNPERHSLIVLCMLRNAVAWLPTYLRHYRELGVGHFVFLDNDSDDETREILALQDDVSLFATDLSFADYVIVLKRWLVRTFGRGRWSLVADIDELFDYPYSERLPLSDFLAYLDRRHYNAVSVQNLEMVTDRPLADVQGRREEDLEALYTWYDISAIRRVGDKYWLRMNEFDSERQYMHTGGIRESGFGWAGSMLTKQALLRYDGDMQLYPYDGHFVTGARIADVTAVFKHYKFIGSFYEHMREEIRRQEHYDDARIFKRYAKVLEENPQLRLAGPEARRYERAEELLESGFLIASDDYLRWVERHSPEGLALARRS